MLAAAGRTWAYADAIAQRMFHVDRVTFCSAEQQGKLIAALSYDQKRREPAQEPQP
jgi:phage gp16-like protein